MVIPGSATHCPLIKHAEPQGSAKYVEFVTLADAKQMPGVRSGVLDWPYTEGLRMDEAHAPADAAGLRHVRRGAAPPERRAGARGRALEVRLQSGQVHRQDPLCREGARTAWNKAAPNEYGFYSNVNPNVDHPRWSQATERRIGEDGLFAKRRKTLMFNGYEAEVGQLYAGMDLKKFFEPTDCFLRALLLRRRQAGAVRAVPAAAGLAHLRRGHRWPGRQPGRGADPLLRRLDAALSVPDARRHPVRIRTRTPQLARFRRMLGLFVIFYASCTCWPIPGWTWADAEDIARDILKRPFILVGFSCWLLLWPLALTFNRAVRWLGGRQWQALHRLIYLIAGLALLHFFWMRAGKNNFAEVQVYALIIGVLLLERLLLLHAAPSFVRALTWARQNSRTQRAQSFAKDAKDSEIQRSR
jgi:DMSO/TMAO reductase YedYZ heme-binding membrane subunit